MKMEPYQKRLLKFWGETGLGPGPSTYVDPEREDLKAGSCDICGYEKSHMEGCLAEEEDK